MPERETSRQAAEQELLAVREEVRQLTENMRARLADQDSTATDVAPRAPQQPHDEYDAAPHVRQQHDESEEQRTAPGAVAHVPQQPQDEYGAHAPQQHHEQCDERDELDGQCTAAGAAPQVPQQPDELDVRRTAADAVAHVPQQHDAEWHVAQQGGERDEHYELGVQCTAADALPRASQQARDEQEGAPHHQNDQNDEHGGYGELDGQRAVTGAAPRALERPHEEYGAHAPQHPDGQDDGYDRLDVSRAAWRLGGSQ
ncbi:MAG TPA: hypothetical protein VGL05_01605 [Kribbella sp.]